MTGTTKDSSAKFAESISDGKKQPYLQHWPPRAPTVDAKNYGVPEGESLVLNSQGAGGPNPGRKVDRVD
ncbi:hypothetical protein ASPCAL14389 [Aspergillus calidoustus]|uniref:Uncharacterized protein n=1 Tax=Aspergillus calidoustus TaxID=454130 RepID=A0A0U5GHE6_ASPCI|nr:hypothetical protein ASPCAL14389 [Aspergillus calidoustus]